MSRRSQLYACALVVLAATACGNVVNQSPATPDAMSRDASSPGDHGPTSDLPECQAQRAVYLVGGYGGLAWFSLVWPVPKLVTSFESTYAYDDPSLVANVSTDSAHPLYARKLGDRAVWDGRGLAPQPSVLVAGWNESRNVGRTFP